MNNTLDDMNSSSDSEQRRLELRRLELDVLAKEGELHDRRRKSLLPALTSPLALAIVGGFVTLMTSIATTTFTASQNRALEDQKLQAELIKKFVEGPTQAAVRKNLQFLVDSNLIPNYRDDIEAYLKNNPNSAPQVRGGIQGFDDAVDVAALPPESSLAQLARSVGRLTMLTDSQPSYCTAFLIAKDLIATAGHCVTETSEGINFRINGSLHEATLVSRERGQVGEISYAVLRLAKTIDDVPVLRLSTDPPVTGDGLSMVMFRSGDNQLAESSDECRALVVNDQALQHGCDTGAGASGAPVVRAGTTEVVGIHAGGGWATLIAALPPGALR